MSSKAALTALARSKARPWLSPLAWMTTSPPWYWRTLAAMASITGRYFSRTSALPGAKKTSPISSSTCSVPPSITCSGSLTPQSKRTGTPGETRRSSGLSVVNCAPAGSVDGSTFRMKLRPRSQAPPDTPARW